MKRKQGELLATCKPYAHVATRNDNTVICEFCFKDGLRGDALKTCQACKVLRYCSVQCQKDDWSLHKHECRCLRQVSPRIPSETPRLFLRLLIRQKNGQNGQLFSGDQGWRTFNDLKSHIDEIRRDATRMSQFAGICHTIRQLVGELWPLPPVADLLLIFGKMVINAFTIPCWESMNPLGTGVYLSASVLDHSCRPNCVAVFRGTLLTLRCITDIEDDSPTGLRIAYVDNLDLTQERQRQFQQQYYFTCTCDSCAHPAESDAAMLGVKCQSNPNCRGQISRRSSDDAYSGCDHCGAMATNPDLVNNVDRCHSDSASCITHIKTIKESGDLTRAFELCTDLIRKQRPLLHERNLYHVKAHHEAFDICLRLRRWRDAVPHGVQALEGLRLHDHQLHPAVSLKLMIIGKALLYIGDERSLDYLIQANEMVVLSHGPDHPMTLELQRLLHQASQLRAQGQPITD